MPLVNELSQVIVVIGLHITENINNCPFLHVSELLEKKGFKMEGSINNDTWCWYTHEKFDGHFHTTQICFNKQGNVQEMYFFKFSKH